VVVADVSGCEHALGELMHRSCRRLSITLKLHTCDTRRPLTAPTGALGCGLLSVANPLVKCVTRQAGRQVGTKEAERGHSDRPPRVPHAPGCRVCAPQAAGARGHHSAAQHHSATHRTGTTFTVGPRACTKMYMHCAAPQTRTRTRT
jgi:hypothetical protein